MNAWKVILATLVIYTAGLLTGGIAVRLLQPARFQPPNPALLREDFVRRMATEVKLSPQQRERILKVVHDSQDRVKELYGLISPEMTEEMQFVRETIRVELDPEQEKRFDEFMRKQQRRKSEFGRFEGSRSRGQGGKPPQEGRGSQTPGEGSRRLPPPGTPAPKPPAPAQPESPPPTEPPTSEPAPPPSR